MRDKGEVLKMIKKQRGKERVVYSIKFEREREKKESEIEIERERELTLPPNTLIH